MDSLAGLPKPIHEGVKVLKDHIYESLAEHQIKREEEITKHPLSKVILTATPAAITSIVVIPSCINIIVYRLQPEADVQETSAEALYRAMFPNLPQYMISLLKLLLAAAPTCKAKTDSINILTDVLPEEMP